MIHIILGFLGSVSGFAISPQFKFNEDFVGGVWIVISRSVVVGLCLGIASLVNGHNTRMFLRSKVDYVVNLFVSSFVGSVSAYFLFYILKVDHGGRWVLVLSMLIYVMLVLGFGLVQMRLHGGVTLLIGEGLVSFKNLIRELGLERLLKNYQCVECSFDELAIVQIVDRFPKGGAYYLIPGVNNCWEKVCSIVRWTKLSAYSVSSIDLVVENELGVVSIETVRGKYWWDLPTRLRMSGFVFLKRLIDLTFAVPVLLFCLPLILAVGLIIKLSDGGPFIFKQVRSGRYGKPFSIFKIRTMRVNSEGHGAQWAKVGDPRVTRLGRVLRKTRIDELPQLWNIIIGNMTLVGPRPERPEFYAIIEKEIPEFNLRLVSKPGLTGWAQVNYPYGASIHDSKMKLLYDLYYIKNAGLTLDLRIITRTVVAMIRGAR